MKVIFIFPNYDCPLGLSIGVSYLSACLKEHGHCTKILHINEDIGYSFDIDNIINDILDYNPGLVAISTGENHFQDMIELSNHFRNVSNIPIAFGGIHVTLNAEKIMSQYKVIDYCMLGEGEDSIIELVDALENNTDATNIKNIWVNNGSNIIKNKMRPLKDITNLPNMDLEGWEFEKITKLRRGWVNISMNRGCPYRCSFCHNVGEVKVLQENYNTVGTSNKELGYLRLRGIDSMISELKHIVKKYPFVKEFSFIDDTFTFNKEYMKDFFKVYAEEIGVPFVCLTTVNDVDEELIQLMKKANCDMIRFGVESATPRIRKNIICRSFPQNNIYKAFSLCKKYGIRTFSYNIIAHPTETKEEILNTLKLNSNLLPSGIRVSLGYPYKGTKYYEIAKKMNQIDDDNVIFHNYSTYTKFKFSSEEKLWIDKCRSYFKWWLNLFLENEASQIYKNHIEYLESLSSKEWNDSAIREQLMKIDEETTDYLKSHNIIHFTSPFSDRPDIVILFDGEISVKKEEIDEH